MDKSTTTTLNQKVAVALEYEGKGAPLVTAKGAGLVAEQILEIAKQHNIPIKEDQQLVELLSQVELNQEIPEVLYEAIAQVLIFAYQINEKPIPGQSSE
ncbi:MAG: EscU/YscU/HrcU family type III secretion system export apparatus switch protein [Thiomicrorhabdus chilensis]|uniref:EscU/YscU/HrcU family type III secretion system export apparatus switch protein n=1 Tax=Thiomicrorhabdus chilensis TaxID=63656 RepID=UPI000422DC87|nr:EscU/YscU/HrcU family type III secretion system export apparatus switch protein [Thiomicrorhabdus chilensis]MDX1346947.1 EscU/YscU/HrcU family type III secretion system export apparatus switch protein [Thiomicrorhabdus chilensis]